MTSRTITIAGFVAIGLALVVVDVVARTGAVRVIPFGRLLRRAMRSRSAQFAIVMAWWWIGAHFMF